MRCRELPKSFRELELFLFRLKRLTVFRTHLPQVEALEFLVERRSQDDAAELGNDA